MLPGLSTLSAVIAAFEMNMCICELKNERITVHSQSPLFSGPDCREGRSNTWGLTGAELLHFGLLNVIPTEMFPLYSYRSGGGPPRQELNFGQHKQLQGH